MYSAKIINKEYVNGALRVTVEFSDGTTTVTETCIPQNFDGLKHWVRSRLETFNSGKDIDAQFPVDTEIDPTDPVVPPPTPTAEEVARAEWLKRYFKYVKVKTTLVDTGVLPADNNQVVTLRNWLTANILPAYLDFI